MNFAAVVLDEVDARMQLRPAEERIGAIAEGRGDRGLADQRRAHRQDRQQPAQAVGLGDVARRAGERLVEGGRGGIDRERNERAADAALGGGRDERIGGEPGARHHGGKLGRAGARVGRDLAERRRLSPLHAIERNRNQAQPRRSAEIGIVGGGEEVGADAALCGGLRPGVGCGRGSSSGRGFCGPAAAIGATGAKALAAGPITLSVGSERAGGADRRQSRAGRLGGGD